MSERLPVWAASCLMVALAIGFHPQTCQWVEIGLFLYGWQKSSDWIKFGHVSVAEPIVVVEGWNMLIGCLWGQTSKGRTFSQGKLGHWSRRRGMPLSVAWQPCEGKAAIVFLRSSSRVLPHSPQVCVLDEPGDWFNVGLALRSSPSLLVGPH